MTQNFLLWSILQDSFTDLTLSFLRTEHFKQQRPVLSAGDLGFRKCLYDFLQASPGGKRPPPTLSSPKLYSWVTINSWSKFQLGLIHFLMLCTSRAVTRRVCAVTLNLHTSFFRGSVAMSGQHGPSTVSDTKEKQERHCMYNVTLWRVRVTMVAVETQNAFYVYCWLTCHCQQYKHIKHC